MSQKKYTAEQIYDKFCQGDKLEGDELEGDEESSSSSSESGSIYEPVDSSGTLTSDSDDDAEAPAMAMRTRSQVAVAAESHDSDMQQQSASTSAAIPSGELASTSGLVCCGRRRTRSAVTRGDVASPISAVQSGPVARTRRPPRPPRTERTALRAHSALPDVLANPDWQPTTPAAHLMPPFTAQSGIQVETAHLTPLGFFELFLTEDLVQSIVDQSNLYALQFLTANPNCRLARPFEWKPISVSEFRTFLGLTLNMGIVQQSALRSYWSSEPNHHMPMYSAAMARHRYENILRFLHYNDNQLCRPRGDPDYDRLHKIRPLIDYFNEKFADLYTPQQHVCVDESLIPFVGRLSFKQYIPNKRAKYGVKLYKLCERATGYTYKFRVYEGKDSKVEPPNCPDYMGSAGKIVWDLVSPLFHQGYHLYVDNYYSSVPLFKHLFLFQFGCCGTVRRNRRGFPQRLVETRLRRGEKACLRNNELLAVRWKDKRDVFVLSSIHPDTTVEITTATGVVEKPLSVHEYNLNMGGVDFNDQMMAPYLVTRKSRRWYKKVSIYLIQLALYNAFVLYKASGGDGSYLQFQDSIIKALLYPDGARPQTPQVNAVSRLHGQHYPFFLPGTRTKLHAQKKCRVCSKRGVTKYTRVYCPYCLGEPGLCLGECFVRYHTRPDY